MRLRVLLVDDKPDGNRSCIDRDAGFTDLARRRPQGRFDGPAVFFTGRVTPARERRSRELGARIASSGSTFFQPIDAACEEIRQHRS